MQKTHIYIDVNTASQIDEAGNFIKAVSDMPVIERGQWQILCFQFVHRAVDELGVISLTNADMAGNSYILVADNNFNDDDSLMFKSYQNATAFNESDPLSNRFNLDGDWIDGSTADLSKGQMSIRVNADTAKFVNVLNGRESVSTGMYLSLKQYTSEVSNPSSVMRIRFVAKNTIRDWDDAEENPPTGQQTIAWFNSYFANPMEFEFSVDGTEWHATQTADDNYYRQRIAHIGSAWSSAVKLPSAYIEEELARI